MKYLLDTCTFLWLAQQPSRLSPAASAALDEDSATLVVSDVTVLEIALKHAAGKLPLPAAPRVWIPEKLDYHQLERLELGWPAILRSGELPRSHPDPFDRLLAAQAIEAGLTVLTPDRAFAGLGAARLW